MDDIQEFCRSLEDLTPEERDEELERFKSQCICPICPTYNDCAKKEGELLFCIIGKSDECIKDRNDCMCPPCPFARRLDFGAVHNTYCIRGSELEQKK
ncbi:MAG: DUF2769 domain-containing protein [Methanobacterium sp.]|jgi:hypothetical protein|nr:DUF2769 domain-containing protein [Methanobacterium sp.]